jgi:hypothetical protein
MRIFMNAEMPNFTWDNISKFAIIAFVAGGIFMNVQANNVKNSEQDDLITQSFKQQTQAYTALSDSISGLNVALVRLEVSLANRDDDIKEIKEVLIKHANMLNTNHDEIIRLQKYELQEIHH